MRIVNARKKDINDVISLNRAFYKELKDPNFQDYGNLKAISQTNMQKWFYGVLKEVNAGKSIYLLASSDNDETVGHCFVRPLDMPASERSHVGRVSVFILKDYRLRHFGTKLLKRAITLARNRFVMLQIDVFSTNKVGKHLYKKFGFKKWGRAPDYIKRGNRYIDEEFMYLRL